jgi:hypothetical protein
MIRHVTRCKAVLAADHELFGCTRDEGHPISSAPEGDVTSEEREQLEYHQGFTLEGKRARWLDESPGAMMPGVPAVPAAPPKLAVVRPRAKSKSRRAAPPA